MKFPSNSTPTGRSFTSLDHETLAGFARTYDRAQQPVWILDSSRDCVYRNPAADKTPLHDGIPSFEIVNHHDESIGLLLTPSV